MLAGGSPIRWSTNKGEPLLDRATPSVCPGPEGFRCDTLSQKLDCTQINQYSILACMRLGYPANFRMSFGPTLGAYHGTERRSTTSRRASTREHSSHRSLSGLMVS